jgi:hypothetical protein
MNMSLSLFASMRRKDSLAEDMAMVSVIILDEKVGGFGGFELHNSGGTT